MATDALKSTAITNLDAAPPVRTTSGRGAQGVLHQVDAAITVTDAVTAPSYYQMCRVPSNAVIKDILVSVDVTVTTCTHDIGVWYGSGLDVPVAVRGTVIDGDFFASGVDLKTKTSGPVSQMNESATYTAAKRLQPLWQAAGLSSDPGGTFDIVLTSTATASGAAVIYTSVQFVLPGA